MNRRSRRLPELDVAKGLAMFLVVFGHILKFKSPVFNWIFSFHMPLFFFLTGMTFRPEKYKSLGQAVKNKLRTRLFPYFAITFAGFVICLIRPSYRIYMVMTGVKNELLSIFYYAQPAGLYVGQVWFLAVLFFAKPAFTSGTAGSGTAACLCGSPPSRRRLWRGLNSCPGSTG